MANMHLITGYAGTEHVTSEDHAVFNSTFLGSGQYVFDRGSKLAATVVSNNQIRIADGDIYMQGRHIRIDSDTYVDVDIANGAQGYVRNDLIVARYTKNAATGIEEANLVVIQGTASTSSASDPEYTTGNITDGKALQHDMPLYRVPLSGLTVETLVPLFTVKQNNVEELISNHAEDTAAHKSLFAKKADVASPTFTGTPKAPTAKAGTNTTQIATTAFVSTAVNNAVTNAIGGAIGGSY